MADTPILDRELNELILAGKALQGFEKFYADDVEMQENSEKPVRGKDANRKREEEFFGSVQEFHGARLLKSAVDQNASFSEWMWDVTLEDAGRVKMEQVSVREWKDGQVVRERFYYNKN